MSRAGTHPKQVALLRGVAAIGCPDRVVAEVARSMPDEVLAEVVREPEGIEAAAALADAEAEIVRLNEEARPGAAPLADKLDGMEARLRELEAASTAWLASPPFAASDVGSQREAFEAREQHAAESHQRTAAKLAEIERERDEWQGKIAVALGHTRRALEASADGSRGRWEWLTREACKLLLRATNQTPESASCREDLSGKELASLVIGQATEAGAARVELQEANEELGRALDAERAELAKVRQAWARMDLERATEAERASAERTARILAERALAESKREPERLRASLAYRLGERVLAYAEGSDDCFLCSVDARGRHQRHCQVGEIAGWQDGPEGDRVLVTVKNETRFPVEVSGSVAFVAPLHAKHEAAEGSASEETAPVPVTNQLGSVSKHAGEAGGRSTRVTNGVSQAGSGSGSDPGVSGQNKKHCAKRVPDSTAEDRTRDAETATGRALRGDVATEDTGEPAEPPTKKKRGRPQKEARSDEERAAFEEELAAAVGGAGWVLKRALMERTGKLGAWRVQVERGNEFKTAIVKLPEGAGPYSREALRFFRANIAAQLSGDPARAVHPDDRQTCNTCKSPVVFDESKIGETVGGLTLKGWNYCAACDRHTLSRRGEPVGKNPGSGTRKQLAAELRALGGEVEDDESEQGPSARRGPTRSELARAIDAKHEAKKVEARRVELELPPGTIVSRLTQDASNPAREIGVVGALDDGAADVNDDGEPLIEWTCPADSIDAGETWSAYETAADLRVELEPREGAPWPVFNSWSEVAAERRARQAQGKLFSDEHDEEGGAS